MTKAFVNTMISTAVELYIWDCPECGVTYGIPAAFADARRENGGHYFCLNGHKLSWHETEADKAKRQLKSAQDRAAALQANLDQTEASRRAWKGQATRARKAVLAGQCPFCGQHLRDVERHVARVHGDLDAASPSPEPREPESE